MFKLQHQCADKIKNDLLELGGEYREKLGYWVFCDRRCFDEALDLCQCYQRTMGRGLEDVDDPDDIEDVPGHRR